jgi:hypothetical protein
MTEQRTAGLGVESVGCRVAVLIRAVTRASGLPDDEAEWRFVFGPDGLLIDGMGAAASFHLPFLWAEQATAGWTLGHPDDVDPLYMACNAKAAMLIGLSDLFGVFSGPLALVMGLKHDLRTATMQALACAFPAMAYFFPMLYGEPVPINADIYTAQATWTILIAFLRP